MKGETMESVSYISDMRLISETYKEFVQLDSKKNQIAQFQKNGQKILIDASPKKVYEGPLGLWKDAQHQ